LILAWRVISGLLAPEFPYRVTQRSARFTPTFDDDDDRKAHLNFMAKELNGSPWRFWLRPRFEKSVMHPWDQGVAR
jgi:hypothetical protein